MNGDQLISLDKLPIGCFGRVKKLMVEGNNRRRILDLGIIPSTLIESLRKSPAGDPIAYEVRGAVIALRLEEASKILIESVELPKQGGKTIGLNKSVYR